MFPAAWARQHARERLGIDADEIDGGHYVTLSRPRELAERLDAFAAAIRRPVRDAIKLLPEPVAGAADAGGDEARSSRSRAP
jgi:hypothetical protein